VHVLVTGHRGYIGPVVVSHLLAAGHEVVGLDSGLFEERHLEPIVQTPTLVRDLRDVEAKDLDGIDAIVHLAGLSNDPLGSLDPGLTFDINADATVRLAEVARSAGVSRFVFSSSCSVYGAAEEPWVDEATSTRPVTAYGESKARAEIGLAALAGSDFCVTSLRNATAFGYSSGLRTDLVVNDLVAGAYLRGEIRLNSDGSAWRPLIHIRDIAQAMGLVLAAPTEAVNGGIINVGADEQNYTIMDVAKTVASVVPGSRLTIAEGAGTDRRSYRVRFERIRRMLPAFRCEYDLRAGIEDLLANYRRVDLRSTESCVRLATLQELREAGQIDATLRPRASAPTSA
jgi:nucleoside-diphosphate-sugar epimerase